MKVNTYFIALALALATGCAASGDASAPAPQAVRTATVRVGPVRERVRYVGTVQPAAEVQVLAQVAGTVADLPVPEGAAVQAGDVVARIAAPENVARLERARAERERVRAERDLACERSVTDRALGEAGDLPVQQVDASETACTATSAALEAAEAGYAEVVAVTARGQERAPFAGVVLDRLVDPGQSVMPGKPLLRLGSADLEARVLVSEADVRAGVGVGTPVRIEGGAEQSSVTASLAAQAVGAGRALEARIPLEPDGLVPGMSVPVSFVLRESPDAVAVPRQALQRRGDAVLVLVVDGERITEVPVVPGPEEDGWVAVTPRLPEGTRVAVGDLAGIDPSRTVYAVAEVSP